MLNMQNQINLKAQGEMDKNQKEYFLRQQLKAIKKELGEEAENMEEINGYLKKLDEAEDARSGPQGDREEHRPPEKNAPGIGREHRDPHLPGLDVRAALGDGQQGQHEPEAGQEHPEPGPLRAGKGQGADPGIPERAQADRQGPRPDPLLRRPARRRQDLAGQVDRPRPEQEVRAHLPGRRARRGRDPRPPPHLRRRPARQDHPGTEERRHATTRCS